MSAALNIDRIHPFSHLNERIHQVADHSRYFGRLWKTIKLVKEKQGCIRAAGASVGLVAAAVYTSVFSYFCLEGAGRSLEETYVSLKENGKLVQAIGDAGGWISLPIFSFFALDSTLRQIMREGEFAEVKKICQNWHNEVASSSVPQERRVVLPKEEFYVNIHHIFDALAPQCLLYKSVVSRKLLALEIIEGLEVFEDEAELNPASQLSVDRRLKPIYQEIEKDWQKTICFSKYYDRMKTGIDATRAKYGKWRMVGNVITGIALPVLLGVTSLFSAMGEVELGKKIFGEREDLPETGHFGEWPDNLVGAGLAAFFLNKDLILKGDHQLAADIYGQYLNTLNPAVNQLTGDKTLHNRLCEVANADLQQLSSTSFFSQPLQLNEFQEVQ